MIQFTVSNHREFSCGPSAALRSTRGVLPSQARVIGTADAAGTNAQTQRRYRFSTGRNACNQNYISHA